MIQYAALLVVFLTARATDAPPSRGM